MSEPRVLCSIRLNHVQTHARTKMSESCLVKDPTTSTAIARGILHLCLDTETVFRDAILRSQEFSGSSFFRRAGRIANTSRSVHRDNIDH